MPARPARRLERERRPDLQLIGPKRVCIYCRVSGEEQAEQETIQAQTRLLIRDAQSRMDKELPIEEQVTLVCDPIIDDGISGTVPLRERAGGRRIIELVEAGEVDEVWIYALDRLARKLELLIGAERFLREHDVGLISQRDGIRTNTHTGRLVFHVLGAICEWEKENITERMTMGRNRVAQDGKWTGGPVPFGFTVDDRGCLIPNPAEVPQFGGIPEWQVALDIFERMAKGSTCEQESRRLRATGLPSEKRYQNGKKNGGKGKILQLRSSWSSDRIRYMIRSTTYKGQHMLKTSTGMIIRSVRGFVPEDLWDAANRVLDQNKDWTRSQRSGERNYYLRGKAFCGNCGGRYVGHGVKDYKAAKKGRESYRHYYICAWAKTARGNLSEARKNGCKAKHIRAEWLETVLYEHIRVTINQPEKHIAQAIAEVAERRLEIRTSVDYIKELKQRRMRLDAGRQELLAMVREGEATRDEVRPQLQVNQAAQEEMQRMITEAEDEVALADAHERQVMQVREAIDRARFMLSQLDAGDLSPEDKDDLRTELFQTFIKKVVITTTDTNDGPKQSSIRAVIAPGQEFYIERD